jgi:hypothetical protein
MADRRGERFRREIHRVQLRRVRAGRVQGSRRRRERSAPASRRHGAGGLRRRRAEGFIVRGEQVDRAAAGARDCAGGASRLSKNIQAAFRSKCTCTRRRCMHLAETALGIARRQAWCAAHRPLPGDARVSRQADRPRQRRDAV